MSYRFSRVWGRGSAIVGLGLIGIAFVLAVSAVLIGLEDTERFPIDVRATAALIVMLAGLILGGTMIVAGQLICVLVDQRDLLHGILARLPVKGDPGPSDPIAAAIGGKPAPDGVTIRSGPRLEHDA